MSDFDESTAVPGTVRRPMTTRTADGDADGGVPIWGGASVLAAQHLSTLGAARAGQVDWAKLQGGLINLFVEAEQVVGTLDGAARLTALTSFASTNSFAPVRGGYVTIDAAASDGDGAALLAALQSYGLQNGAFYGAMASGMLPIEAIDDIATLGALQFARPAYSTTHTGSVSNQGDASMYADSLRGVAGLTGAGISIGILSDSFNTSTSTINYAKDVATNDLPGDVKVLADYGGGTDEGRAMAQLVYDVAPGAKLAFNTANNGQAGFAQGIAALSAISNIVVDDVAYYAEPFYSDGIVAKAVDAAVASGDVYFSSAGNEAAQSYESVFVNSGLTLTNPYTGVVYRLHDFDPGAGIDTIQTVRTGSGGAVVSLQWDQPFYSVNPGTGGSANDIALIFRNSSGTVIGIIDDSNVGGDPVELAGLNSGTYYISIGVLTTTADPGFIKYVASGTITSIEYATNSSTTVGHADAAGAIAVGAAPFYRTPAFGVSPPQAESFTSKGGTQILFDANGTRIAAIVRDKVEITAPDGGNTTFFYSDSTSDTDTFPNFFGTSAAAPNAAAVAALLLQKYPGATPAQIEAALKASAVDITASIGTTFTGLTGTDAFTGTGLIRAPEALTALGQALGVVSRAPTGVDRTVAVLQAGTYTVRPEDLYTDLDGNALLTMTVTAQTATSGSFKLSGATFANGTVIAGADIANGLLTFVSTGSGAVHPQATISFTLRDGGGTAMGGQDTDSSANTLTLDNSYAVPVSTNYNGDVAAFYANGTVGGAAVRIDTGTAITLSDADSANYAGGTLSVRIVNAVAGEDQLLAAASGTGASSPTGAVFFAGETLSQNGTTIGSVTAATATSATIALGSGATPALVGSLISAISYADTNNATPTLGVRQIEVVLTESVGGYAKLAMTSAVTVSKANLAPGGTDATFLFAEDGRWDFYAPDFGFTDPDGNYLAAVKFTTLPAVGLIKNGSASISVGQVISLADIEAYLSYYPAANGNGTGYASFTFQVQDTGGTVSGGMDLDPTPNTITFNVTSINDAPAGTTASRPILEDTAYPIQAADFGFFDASDSPANTLLAVKVTTLPAAGTLTLGGVAVTPGQFVPVGSINTNALVYTPVANSTTTRSFTFQVQDNGGTANGGIDLDQSANTLSFVVTAINDAPTGAAAMRTFLEDATYTFAASDFALTDVNDSPANTLLAVKITTLPTLGTLTLAGGAVSAGQFVPVASLPQLVYAPVANGNGNGYASFTFQVQDNGGTANGGVDIDPGAKAFTFNVTPVDDLPVAVADNGTVAENGTVAIAVVANDTDVEGDARTVASIAGTAVTAGQTVTLGTGATAKLNVDGTITYDPNHKFDYLVTMAKATAAGTPTGPGYTSATDSFSYAINGGSSAIVTVAITPVDNAGDHLSGSSGDNSLTGTAGADSFDLSQGGSDTVAGGDGNDGFVFGASFGPGDMVDGGTGTNDQLILQGTYGAPGTPFTLLASQIVNTEVLALLPGGSYTLASGGGLYGAGLRTIFASNLTAIDSFSLDVHLETGPIIVYGGRAADSITTGSGDDGIYFGPGRFDPTLDRVNAGAGTNDQLALDGDYGTVGSPLVLTGTAIQGVEGIVLIAGPTSAPSHFNIAFANDFANAGQAKYVQGITVTTAMTITAVAETDATSSYQFNAGLGDDTLVGGAGNDRLFGNLGRDTLTGGGGNDTFFYDAAVQSSSTHYDTITDFQVGSDTIDLPGTYAAPATVTTGSLSDATFDADLAAALNATLTVGRAVIFTPSTGDHAGQTFLVADANATAGYQADGDYVIQIVTAPANTPLVGILS